MPLHIIIMLAVVDLSIASINNLLLRNPRLLTTKYQVLMITFFPTRYRCRKPGTASPGPFPKLVAIGYR